MPRVSVRPLHPEPSHDISLASDAETFGFIYLNGPSQLQEIPISEPSRPFTVTQKAWFGGKGRVRYQDDPNGFFDNKSLWTMTDGKLFPVPQWKFAKNIRANDMDLPGSLTWQSLLGTKLYISRSFTASSSYSADKAYIWVRRVGNPGTLTLKLHSNNSGSPGTVLQTVTKAYTDLGDSSDPEPPSEYMVFDWTGTESLTASTLYHLSIFGATTDNDANHWEVGCDMAGSASKVSSDGSTWGAGSPTFGMYFRVTDADTNRQWFPFTLEAAQYIVSKNDDSSVASKVFINGDRFRPTTATTTVLTDTSSGVSTGWTTDQYAGARAKIIGGAGDGQDRLISSNTSTAITITPALETAANTTTTSVVIYGTDYWTEVTGHGLGQVVSRPAVGGKVTYFPQGESVNMRHFYVNHTQAIQHSFGQNGTNKADLMAVFSNPAGTQVWKVRQLTAGAARAAVVTAGSNLVFGSEKIIGGLDYRITNLFVADELYAGKEDSLWRFEADTPRRLKTGVEGVADPSNYLAASPAPGVIWLGWNHSIARMVGSEVSDQLNFRAGYDGMPSDRAGVATCIVAALGWVFFAIDGGSSNYSSILVWNGFGWAEIFRGWAAGVRIRNIFWQSNVNARSRLWFDIGGDLAYMEFPLRNANPLLDTTIPYQHEAVLVTSTFDANDPTLYKLFHNFRLVTDSLGTTGKVLVDWQFNTEIGTGAWHTLGEMAAVSLKEFILDLGEAYSIRFRLRLQTTSATVPPVVRSYSSEGWVSTPTKYQWIGTFKVGVDYSTKNNQDDHKPDDLVKFIREAADKEKKLHLRSLKTSMDDKIVTVSSPVVITDSVTDEGWKGRISFAMREA